MTIEDPDRDLVKACQDPGSDAFEPAFSALYEKYRDRVYNIAWRVTGDPVEAMDVCQETFTVLLRKISSFHFDSKFSSWLYRIVVNASIDSKRKTGSRRKRELEFPRFSDEDRPYSLEDPEARAPEDGVVQKEREELVHEAIQKLSPKLRAVVVLRYLQDLSYEEVATILQVSMGTVKSRLARAHLALNRHLAPLLEAEEKKKEKAGEFEGNLDRPE